MLRREHGAGALSTLMGVAVVLSFLLLAAQVLVHLYATTTVSAAAADSARLASAFEGAEAAEAETYGRELLGTLDQHVEVFDVAVGPDAVRARVVARSPAILARALTGVAGLGRIEREVVMRRERVTCEGC